MGIEEPGIADVSRAVIHIRRSKLPDPAVTGNAGSFFKNPEVDARLAQALKVKNPQMPAYDLPDGRVKIPAAWLIEQCGWKGKSLGNAGCHSRQPLVLINLGGATGSEILQLAQTIQRDVKERFGIELHTEVNII
jgi:UDP-N-acetylmuramate dehydrogenase